MEIRSVYYGVLYECSVYWFCLLEESQGFVSVQAFSKLPDTLDELDALLNEERSRAEGFTGIRENVSTSICILFLLCSRC